MEQNRSGKVHAASVRVGNALNARPGAGRLVQKMDSLQPSRQSFLPPPVYRPVALPAKPTTGAISTGRAIVQRVPSQPVAARHWPPPFQPHLRQPAARSAPATPPRAAGLPLQKKPAATLFTTSRSVISTRPPAMGSGLPTQSNARLQAAQPRRTVVQLSGWKFGANDDEMSNQQWFKSGMSTFGSILVEDEDNDGELVSLKVTKNLKTVTYGNEHAEDVAIRVLHENYSDEELNGLLVILNLSKSPCSSKFGTSNKLVGCAEELVDFVKDYKVNLIITCRGLYKGLHESQEAVDWMRSKGINISVDVRVGREKRFGEG